MFEPLIACLCPTYKRPELLRNSIACFNAQTYRNKLLVILDDADQHASQRCDSEKWRLLAQRERFPNLPAKLNALAAMVPEADILAVWEDDDIYLPHHLASIAEAAAASGDLAFFAPNRVLSTYNLPPGETQQEGAAGRFHASWAYTRGLWRHLGGYEPGEQLQFDQQMGARCRDAAGITHYDETEIARRFGPSYVYRWGNGVYHGSQAGEEGFRGLWLALGQQRVERVENTGPLMDDATRMIYAAHGWADRCPGRGSETADASKSQRRKQSVCLAMLVRNEGAIIERCLASVRNVIDTWVIVDTGSTDNTEAVARNVLQGVSGEWHALPWVDFATNRNQLLELSRHRADYTLWLDADETVAMEGDALDRALTALVYEMEVQTSRGCFMQPRLIGRHANAAFVGPVAESLVGGDPVVPLEGVAIRHHEDGVRWRDPARLKRDVLRLEAALLDQPDDPRLILALADCHAASGDFVSAQDHYRRRAGLGGDEAETWYALYQVARMLDERAFSTPAVTEAYMAAFDLRPSKAEPLVRIAMRCLREGRNETAADIAWTAVTTPAGDRAHFFEPAVYGGQADLLFLRASLLLGRHAAVIEHAETVIRTNKAHTPEMRREIEEIRSMALQQRNAPPPNEVVTVAPVAPPPPVVVRPIPPATPRREKRRMCIGMATYDDYDGVYFSVQAIRMFHPEISDRIEILVIDNNPTGPCSEGLKALDAWVANYRYVPEAELRGTATRDLIFREANADFVLVIDCHVMIVPGALRRLLEYFEADPECNDLLQGPLVYDDLTNISTHFAPVWRAGMYGTWDCDPRGTDPEAPGFEIPMQGLGLFACRRDAWPGFNPRFRGFGGEEGYIHEKFRQAGGKALCLPFLRWVHRFHRPMGLPYTANWYDRLRNYWIGHHELGLDLLPISEHFNTLLGEQQTASFKARLDRELESALYQFDGVYLCRERGAGPIEQSNAAGPLQRLGVVDRAIPADLVSIDSANGDIDHAVARALTHRGIVERARRQGLQNVLIIEDAAALERAMPAQDGLRELQAREWSVFLFDPPPPNTSRVTHCATAYHASAYEQVLAQIPDEAESARRWVVTDEGPLSHLRTDKIIERHRRNVSTPSDINEHLDTIRRYAGSSAHVTEMGVRDATSTWSLLAGKPKTAVSYDVYRSPQVSEVEEVAKEYGIAFQFIQKDVLDVKIDPTDLLFIDTFHTYDQLRSELDRHGNRSRKYIILHDTATYRERGETGERPGLEAAIAEFLERNRHWHIAESFSNNNGLTCLERRSSSN